MLSSKRLQILAICAFSTAITILLACENTVNFKNSVPSEVTITPSKCYVAAGGKVQLTGYATDEDGDSLTFYWSAPSGSFVSLEPNGSKVEWTSSATPGPVTITMTVSDEIAAVTKKQVITACELLPASGTTILVSRTIPNAGHFYITRSDAPLRIPGNVDVTIEPGVTIVVDRPLGGIEVFGQLIAVGAPSQRIRIMGNSCGSETALWTGIYFIESEAHGTMRYCDITSGMDGITARDGGVASLRDCQIYNQLDFGVSSIYGSSVEVVGCNVWDNGDGIFVDDADAVIRRTSVRYNDGDGIVCNWGAEEVTSVVSIDSCVIANNVSDGIELGAKSAPEIHYCSIFANNEANSDNYALRLVANIAAGPIHAENNYWGLGNDTEPEIADIILDANDNPANLPVVSFTPWLTQAPVARSAGAQIAGGAWAR